VSSYCHNLLIKSKFTCFILIVAVIQNYTEGIKTKLCIVVVVIKRRIPVDKSDLFAMLDIEASPAKTKSKKRKWREIEALQDRFKLEKELSELDCGFEYELETLER
jgi:hypothetical protein